MIGAEPEAGGLEAVQTPDSPTQCATLHPQEIGFADALGYQALGLCQNGIPDGLGIFAVAGCGEQSHTLHRLKATAKGGIDKAFFVQFQIQLGGLAKQRLCRQITDNFTLDTLDPVGQSLGLEAQLEHGHRHFHLGGDFFLGGFHGLIPGSGEADLGVGKLAEPGLGQLCHFLGIHIAHHAKEHIVRLVESLMAIS